jgi:hypothetical protein
MYVVFTENEIYAFDATDQQLIDFAGNLSFLQQYLIYERMRCPSLSLAWRRRVVTCGEMPWEPRLAAVFGCGFCCL